MSGGWVYIMTNRPNGTLYVGCTTNQARRIWEHREGVADGFTKRYGLKRLVYAERYDDILTAKQREMNMKALAARLEGAADPEEQFELGRPVRQHRLIERCVDGRAKPGQGIP